MSMGHIGISISEMYKILSILSIMESLEPDVEAVMMHYSLLWSPKLISAVYSQKY